MESFINFPKDIEDVFTPPPNFFIKSDVNCDIEDTIIFPNDNVFIELEHKSFCYSLNGNYKNQKIINQNVYHLRNSNKTNCEWHYNFKLPKTKQHIRCTTLINTHNYELNSAQIAHLNARYRQFNDNMMQDLAFFTDCKVVPIVQLEILKKKYPEHVFHKQDVYNSIYKLHENNKDENLDSGLLLNVWLSGRLLKYRNFKDSSAFGYTSEVQKL
ncbi:hypothetical protein RhiirB3_444652 [Rhizophagus irregularis]|nr:hypothetical protein RhiirB3_444652 [Rhizophagus irregularis]